MKHKNDMIQFAVWTRNGIAFSITWFLTLVLIYNSVTGIQSILTESLIKMMFWIIGGVLLFNLFFYPSDNTKGGIYNETYRLYGNVRFI